MNALLASLIALAQLGSPDYHRREAAERQLQAEGWAGWAIARCNTGHVDPEVRARCRRVVNGFAPALTLQHHAAVVTFVLWPCADGWESDDDEGNVWVHPTVGMDDKGSKLFEAYLDAHSDSFPPVAKEWAEAFGVEIFKWSTPGNLIYRMRERVWPDTKPYMKAGVP